MGYVIDLDSCVLEVYQSDKGAKKPKLEGRFVEVNVHGQELKATFHFDSLPSEDEFVEAFE